MIAQKDTRRSVEVGYCMITMLIVEEGLGNYKSHATRKFSVKLCFLETTEKLPPWSLMCGFSSSILFFGPNVYFCAIPYCFYYHTSIIILNSRIAIPLSKYCSFCSGLLWQSWVFSGSMWILFYFSIFMKNLVGILIAIALNLLIDFGRMVLFTILILLVYEHLMECLSIF